MTEQTAPRRRFLQDTPAAVIARLPRVGKLMVIGKRNGATHERIGTIENVVEDNGLLRCQGVHHDSTIDASGIVAMIVDTSSVMRDQVYPRIDFNGADGQPVFSIVGFGGLEPFEAALEGLAAEEEGSDFEKPARPERAELAADDAGGVPLHAALASGRPVSIGFAQPGFTQRWNGTVQKVSPGMGFINVMTEDFHLHLLGGTVGGWREEAEGEGIRLIALDLDGKPTGLSLHSAHADAFVAVPVVEQA